MAVTARNVYSIGPGGDETWTLDPDELVIPMSTLKMLTAYTARQHITDSDLDTQTATVHEPSYGSRVGLVAGDVVSFRDLMYGMVIRSGNDATLALARHLGEQFLGGAPGDPTQRFVDEMWEVAATRLGWTGHVINDPAGLSSFNRVSARQMVTLMQAIADEDPWLRGVAVAPSWTVTVLAGPDPRTITTPHTINAGTRALLYDFAGGKTGANGVANVVLWWDAPDGRHTTALLTSTRADRYADLRAVQDEIVAAIPDEPEPEPLQSFDLRVGHEGQRVRPVAMLTQVGGRHVALWP